MASLLCSRDRQPGIPVQRSIGLGTLIWPARYSVTRCEGPSRQTTKRVRSGHPSCVTLGTRSRGKQRRGRPCSLSVLLLVFLFLSLGGIFACCSSSRDSLSCPLISIMVSCTLPQGPLAMFLFNGRHFWLGLCFSSFILSRSCPIHSAFSHYAL